MISKKYKVLGHSWGINSYWMILNIVIIFLMLFSCLNNKAEEYKLGQFPEKLTRLTETDSTYIIFNSCDAGNLLISFREKSELLFHGQQENYEFEIIDSQKLEGDTIKILTNWKGASESQTFYFTWVNQEKGLIKLVSAEPHIVGMNLVFVDERHETDYSVYNQPCIECWPEEECN